jgi:hypothetical protein
MVKDLVDGRMTEVDKLAQVIRDLHGVEPTHVRSELIHETFRCDTVWDGTVEVFSIRGHPKAGIAYAWSHERDHGGRRWLAVLVVPPIKDAMDEVRASIAAEHVKDQSNGARSE